jgi:hypothetical protein
MSIIDTAGFGGTTPADVYDPGGLFHHPKAVTQPGVVTNSSAVVNPANLQRDPISGRYFDPTTGTTYADPMGKTPIVNPNVAQQVATASGNSQSILGDLTNARATGNQALAGQTGLVNQLNGTIAGNTPSVAQNQLTQTLGGIQRNQAAMASGYGGANAFSAQRQAAANTGAAQQSASQAAAIQRAQEIQAATAQKGQVLQSIAGNANTQGAQDVAGAVAFGDTAMKGQQAQQGLNTSAAEKKAADDAQKKNGIIAAIGSLI